VTTLALPLTGIVILHASTFEVGLLYAMTTVAFALVTLPAGVIVDRVSKRWLMLGCDIGRLLFIGSVPLAAVLGVLSLAQLYVVALGAGLLTVFFDVAYQSYVPMLIERNQLMSGNARLGTTESVAQVAGPGLAAVLFGQFGAARAMAGDALSYLASAVSLSLISQRGRAGRSTRPAERRRRWTLKEISEGLRFVLAEPTLRKIMACTASWNLFGSMVTAIDLVFLVRDLHVKPAYTGLLFAVGSIGGIVGGILVGPLSRKVGSARVIWLSPLILGACGLLIPLARPGWRVALFAVGSFGIAFLMVVYGTAQLSYRQAICRPELLGRMNAAVRWVIWGILPLGAFLAGALGTAVGVRNTLWIAVIGEWASAAWVVFSPLRDMRDMPSSAGDDAA
jgi:MFS family permease